MAVSGKLQYEQKVCVQSTAEAGKQPAPSQWPAAPALVSRKGVDHLHAS